MALLNTLDILEKAKELEGTCWGIRVLPNGNLRYFYHPYGCEQELSASNIDSLILLVRQKKGLE